MDKLGSRRCPGSSYLYKMIFWLMNAFWWPPAALLDGFLFTPTHVCKDPSRWAPTFLGLTTTSFPNFSAPEINWERIEGPTTSDTSPGIYDFTPSCIFSPSSSIGELRALMIWTHFCSVFRRIHSFGVNNSNPVDSAGRSLGIVAIDLKTSINSGSPT